jgi:hypothetical protein
VEELLEWNDGKFMERSNMNNKNCLFIFNPSGKSSAVTSKLTQTHNQNEKMTAASSILLLFSFAMTSCATGDAIIIKNKSAREKNMVVYYPAGFSFPAHPDSLQAWDLNDTEDLVSVKDIYRNSLKIPATADTSGKGWAFVLKPGYEVTVLAWPTHRRIIKNTLVLSDHDTLRVKRSGNCWIYTIK